MDKIARLLIATLWACFWVTTGQAADRDDEAELKPAFPDVLSPKDQAELHDAWLEERLDTVIPQVMREQRIDMWILVAREYMEDPVIATMLNATSMRARRRTILVFFDRGPEIGVERRTVSRYNLGTLFQLSWIPEEQPDQWARLAEIVTERNPKRIALNTSPQSAFGDGLTHSQHNALLDALPSRYRRRVVSGHDLSVRWLETRTPAEMEMYPEVVQLAHAIIGEAFSNDVITPGITTVDDVVWWYRQRIVELGVTPWFHPTVSIFRQGTEGELKGDSVILPGDMLWTDLGITYLDLNTDTQHLAYVLRAGETGAPEGLKAGLAAANAVQDAVTDSFALGSSGNDVLRRARSRALAEGYQPSIYTHAIGFHGHGAGPAIGFWDNQDPTEQGEGPIRANTAWSIELSATVNVPEWDDQPVPFRTEEEAFFDGSNVQYMNGRQKRFHLIKSNN
ncbi:MAG: M24 family metallopeptidase [Pseudomonadota bacterium]